MSKKWLTCYSKQASLMLTKCCGTVRAARVTPEGLRSLLDDPTVTELEVFSGRRTAGQIFLRGS